MAVYLGDRPVLANGVGGTSIANAHASEHAAGGGDALTPAMIGAAEAAHTHPEYAESPTALTVSLPLSGWTQYTYSCSQTVLVNGMRSGTHAIVGPSGDSWIPYSAAGVRCSVQGYNALTFTADELPLTDLEVNVLIWG